MIVRYTHRFVVTLAVVVLAVLSGVAFKQPALVLLALPFALSIGVAVPGRGPSGPATVTVDHPRLAVGDRLAVDVVVDPGGAPGWVEIRTDIPSALESVDGAGRPANTTGAAVAMTPSGARHRIDLVAGRWGGGQEIRVEVIGHDPAGFTATSRGSQSSGPLRIYPATQQLRRALQPVQLRAIGGVHLSRHRADGVEFAETRPFQAGDRLRAVNWRVSGRREGLWVTDRHPEMSGDVLLYIDSFTDGGADREATLAAALEAAASLSRWHLGINDRVGLVDLGGTLRWIEGGIGARQAYRVAEALIESELIESWADKGIDVIPTRGLPPRSLVIALTPLNDERTVNVLIELRRRRFDLAVIDCSINRPLHEPDGRPDKGEYDDRVTALAHRLAAMEHADTSARLRRAGAAVARWQPGRPLAPVLADLLAERRAWKTAVRA